MDVVLNNEGTGVHLWIEPKEALELELELLHAHFGGGAFEQNWSQGEARPVLLLLMFIKIR